MNMTHRKLLLTACATTLVASCTSTPMHFHTLVPASPDQVPALPVAGALIDVEPVSVPAQVDRTELVVRQKEDGINLLENETWIAPLPDEVRSAILVELVRQLGPMKAESERGNGSAISVQLDVERFESAPAQYALIEAAWRVHIKNPTREASVSCRSRVSESVGPGYIALVRGHQRAVVVIADQIAEASRGLVAAGTAVCPSA